MKVESNYVKPMSFFFWCVMAVVHQTILLSAPVQCHTNHPTQITDFVGALILIPEWIFALKFSPHR